MAVNVKKYGYSKGTDAALDAEFAAAKAYGSVKAGQTVIFWKSGLRWCVISVENLQRIFRRVEPVYGRLCCGGRNFIIEWLVLVLHDGSELVLHIGDDVKKEAEELLEALKTMHPELQYGKV